MSKNKNKKQKIKNVKQKYYIKNKFVIFFFVEILLIRLKNSKTDNIPRTIKL